MNLTDEFLSNQTVLVITPHSDDEAFGCAGTMARIKDLGGEVYVILMSIGDLKQFKEDDQLVEASTRKGAGFPWRGRLRHYL
ncbi:MAG: PIG-L deacetylase family protein [bacterium]